MTERNISKELCYFNYTDMENGNDRETIDYCCLFGLLEEILTRLEKLEARE
jgi:hypothetical protein